MDNIESGSGGVDARESSNVFKYTFPNASIKNNSKTAFPFVDFNGS